MFDKPTNKHNYSENAKKYQDNPAYFPNIIFKVLHTDII